MICSYCGTKNNSKDNFCKNCGKKISSVNSSEKKDGSQNLKGKTTNEIFLYASIILNAFGVALFFFYGLYAWMSFVLSGLGVLADRRVISNNTTLKTVNRCLYVVSFAIGIIIILANLSSI